MPYLSLQERDAHRTTSSEGSTSREYGSDPLGRDIRQYGASPEAEDNYDAIMAAVEDAHERGGTVLVPEGAFHYGQTLDLVEYDHVSIRGSNKRASLLVFDGDGNGIRFASQAAVFSSFRLRGGAGDHRHGIVNDPGAGGGAQDTYHENIRVEGFSNGAAWWLRDAWEHTLIRCDALRCRDGYVLGSSDESKVANDITLHSCNSRQHSGIALYVARAAGAVTVIGGNYAAGRVGIRLGTSYGVTIHGTYHEANEVCDIHLTPGAHGARVYPGYSQSPVGVLVEGEDGEIGGGRYRNPGVAIQIGTPANRARRFTVHRHYFDGNGRDVDVKAGSDILRLDRVTGSDEIPQGVDGRPRSGNVRTDSIIESNRERITALESIIREFGLLESP